MKILSLILLSLSFSLFNLNAVAAGLDNELDKRCNSLPFSLEGTPQTGKFGSDDPNFELKGKLIDGITHVFYPSGKLERRGKRVDDNGNPDLKGERSIGIFESFDEECYLNGRFTRNNNGVLLSGEFFDKGSLSAKGNYTNDQQDGIWEYYKNGILSLRGPWKDKEQHGDWKVYDESGTVTQIDNYEKGKKLTEEYYKNGEINRRNHIIENKYVSVEFFENGKLDQKGPWWDENGKQQGVWSYYEDGTHTKKVTWQNGEIVKEVRITAPWPVTIECSYKVMGVTGIYIGMDLANKTVYTQSIDSFQRLLDSGIKERPDFDIYSTPYIDDLKVVWRANVYGNPVTGKKKGGRVLTLNRETLKLTDATTGQWFGQYINCNVLDPKEVSYQELNDYLDGKWNELKSARDEKLKKRAF